MLTDREGRMVTAASDVLSTRSPWHIQTNISKRSLTHEGTPRSGIETHIWEAPTNRRRREKRKRSTTIRRVVGEPRENSDGSADMADLP